ncbi:MAG TPA: TraR/DksA C4-type zinc finger protein [Actinomycetota bacterium]|jgi:DnaK suppressor protein
MPPAKRLFTKKDLAPIRKKLEEERQQLQRQQSELEQGSLATPQSEMSGEVAFDEEYADAGTATFEREKDLSLSNNLRDLMDQIDRALRRMDDGTYGRCVRCGNPIEKARLAALPYAELCIKDKQAEERSR